jgi:hypothetical protein
MKKSRVQDLLDARHISYSIKKTKFGENEINCVLFKKICKIVESSVRVTVDFSFGDFPRQTFENFQHFEAYLDSNGDW